MDEVDLIISELELYLLGLGSRVWAINDAEFRDKAINLLVELGWEVDTVRLFDKEDYVYGFPSEVEIDLLVRGERVIVVEMAGALKRGDVITAHRKKEFYEMAKGKKVSDAIVITAFIGERDEDKVLTLAKSLGIRVVKPEEIKLLK